MKKKFILKDFLILLISVLVLVGIDQLTKYLFSHNEEILSTGKLEFINGFMYFTLVHNKGAAWGIFNNATFLLAAISFIAGTFFAYITYQTLDLKKNKLLSISTILITSGTFGNFIDRAFFKDGVIDFIQFDFWPLKNFPTFNFADSCLTVGAILLIIYILFIYNKKQNPSKENQNEDNANSENLSSNEEKPC